MQDYLINWNAGPLGVVLRPDLGLDMPPVVVQLLPQQSVLRLSGVRVGDLLISVNGKKTAKLGYDKVVRLLFKERLPIVLHFRVPSGSAGIEASGASDYDLAQLQQMQQTQQFHHQVLPTPPRTLPSTPALPSEQYTERPRSGSSVLGVPTDYGTPPLARGHSGPQSNVRTQPGLARNQSGPNTLPQTPPPMPRGRRSQSLESIPRSRRGSSARHQGEALAKSGGNEDIHKRRKPKDRAEAEERRLRKQYSVIWERGSLGISFRAFNAKIDVPTVDFISTSRGQGRGMERVCINDVLIAVNGEKTKLLGVEKVLRWLHVIDKPVVLRFHCSSSRIPSNPVPQIANAPSLPLVDNTQVPPHPPTRRNTTSSSKRRHSKDGYEEQAQVHYQDYGVDDDDEEFQQFYPPSEPLQQQQQPQGGRRYSTEGPRLPKRNLDDSMHAYIARAHDNRLSSSGGAHNRMDSPVVSDPNEQRLHGSEGSVDAVGDFRREQQPPGLHEFDLHIDAHTAPREGRKSRRGSLHAEPQAQVDSFDRGNQRINLYDATPDSHEEHLGNGYADERVRSVGRGRGGSMDSAHSARRRSHSSGRAVPQSPLHHAVYGGRNEISIVHGTIPPPPPSTSSHSSAEHVGWNTDKSPRPPQHEPQTQLPSPLQPRVHQQQEQPPPSPDQPIQPKNLLTMPRREMTASELTLRAAIEVVARANMKPAEECEFAGVPLHLIQDGTVQAKLLVVYARTCLAKEQASKAAGPMNETFSPAAPKVQPPPPVTGNPLGRKGSHSRFVSYTFQTEDDQREQQHQQAELAQSQAVETASNHSGNSRSSARRPLPQSNIYEQLNSVPPVPVAHPPSEPRPSRAPSGDFIPLQDFELQEDGSLTDRRTGSNVLVASAATAAADGEVPASDDATPRSSENPPSSEASSQLRSVISVGALSHDINVAAEGVSSVGSGDVLSITTAGSSVHPDMTSLDDLISLPTGRHAPAEQNDLSTEDDADVDAEEPQAEVEPSALVDPRVAYLFSTHPDVHPTLVGKRPSFVLVKKSMIDEIQEILDSLQMESQFERHSHMGMGTLPSPPPMTVLDTLPSPGVTNHSCSQCGKRSNDLVEMEGEWYCQDCWEFFFYSDDHEPSPSPKSKNRSYSVNCERGSELDDSSVDDEAFKYSFHDSAFGQDDVLMMRLMTRPSPSPSSQRDSALTTASSITENGDEVWL